MQNILFSAAPIWLPLKEKKKKRWRRKSELSLAWNNKMESGCGEIASLIFSQPSGWKSETKLDVGWLPSCAPKWKEGENKPRRKCSRKIFTPNFLLILATFFRGSLVCHALMSRNCLWNQREKRERERIGIKWELLQLLSQFLSWEIYTLQS